MSETEHPDSRPLDMSGFGPALLFAMAALSVTLSGSLTADTLGYVLGKAVISLCLAFPVYLGIRFGTARGRGLSRVRRINILCIAALAMWLLQLLAAVALEHQLRARSAGDPLSLVDPQRAHGKTDRSQLEPVQRVAEPSEEPTIHTAPSADNGCANIRPVRSIPVPVEPLGLNTRGTCVMANRVMNSLTLRKSINLSRAQIKS